MADPKQQTFETYEKIADGYSKSNFDPFWVKEFETYTSLVPGKKILDIGSGAGRDAVVFTNAGFEYTGIDASPAMLAVAKERAPKGEYKVMDFYHLEFPGATFDGFWAAASFLHVPKVDVSKLLLEAKRVIKAGGVGFISLKERNGMSEGVIEEDRYGGIARYFAFYEKGEFEKYIQEAGFGLVGKAEYHEDDSRKTVWLGFFVKKP